MSADLPTTPVIAPAGPADLPDVLRVQREAFSRVAAAYRLDPEVLPPLRESLDDLLDLQREGMRFLIARVDGEPVGTVRGLVRPDGVGEVGRLAVADGWERRGIARALMAAVEHALAPASRIELFTGAEAREPLALYASLGYLPFREDRIAGGPALVWLAREPDGPLTPTPTPPTPID